MRAAPRYETGTRFHGDDGLVHEGAPDKFERPECNGRWAWCGLSTTSVLRYPSIVVPGSADDKTTCLWCTVHARKPLGL